jgi:hypothetical protein
VDISFKDDVTIVLLCFRRFYAKKKCYRLNFFPSALLLLFISHLVLQKFKNFPPNFFHNCGSDFYASFLMGPMAHFFEVTALPIGPGLSRSHMLIC